MMKISPKAAGADYAARFRFESSYNSQVYNFIKSDP
jgi:hypothetical protein